MIHDLAEGCEPTPCKPDKPPKGRKLSKADRDGSKADAAAMTQHLRDLVASLGHWLEVAKQAATDGDASRAAEAAFYAGGLYEQVACVRNYGTVPSELGFQQWKGSQVQRQRRSGTSSVTPEVLHAVDRLIADGLSATAACKEAEVCEQLRAGIGWQRIYAAWKESQVSSNPDT
jgi:hypothetical protein